MPEGHDDSLGRLMARTDRPSRIVATSVGRVYAALVDPEALAAWLPLKG